jgi:hypothetical protein
MVKSKTTQFFYDRIHCFYRKDALDKLRLSEAINSNFTKTRLDQRLQVDRDQTTFS